MHGLEGARTAAEAGRTGPHGGSVTEAGGSEVTGVVPPGSTEGTACVWPAGKLCSGPTRQRTTTTRSWLWWGCAAACREAPAGSGSASDGVCLERKRSPCGRRRSSPGCSAAS